MTIRLDRIRELLVARNLDAAIITSATNRRYATGFTGEDHAPDESAGITVVAREGAWIFASPTNLPWVRSEISDDITPVAWKRPWAASIADLAIEHGWNAIGFEDRTTTVADFYQLTARLQETPFTGLGGEVDDLRAVKDARELVSLREAARLTDEAFVRTWEQIAVGMTEREIARLVQGSLRQLGSEGEAFDTIVASGPNAAKPHHAPGDRPVQEGEPITIDMGGIVDGYCGDLTRTIWLGHASEQLVTIYRAVAGAHARAIPLYRAGAHGREIDGAVRSWFAEQDLGEFFVHGLGHGLGLRIHEAPSVGPASEDTLAAGHVVSVEPGLYIADWGGVRIENVVVVTDGEPEDLTRAPIPTID